MGEFTPRPWRLEGAAIIGPDKSVIGLCSSTEANACLLVSALDLYTACKAVVAKWESGDLAGAVRRCDELTRDIDGNL